MCVCMCACVCVCLADGPIKNDLKSVSPFFQSPCKPQKRHPTTYAATLELMTLTYFLKVKESNLDHLERLNLIISKTEQTLQLATQEIAYWLSIGIFIFDLDSF